MGKKYRGTPKGGGYTLYLLLEATLLLVHFCLVVHATTFCNHDFLMFIRKPKFVLIFNKKMSVQMI